MTLPLEPDADQRRLLTEAVSAYLDEFFSHLEEAPVSGNDLTPDVISRLTSPPREEGLGLDETLDLISVANRAGCLHPSGGHMAYIPNGGLFTGSLGSYLASALNRYTGVSGAAPGFAHLEATVLRWLSDLFELPDDRSAGVLLSGGSMANFTALVAARTARLPEDFLSGTIYVTAHAHHSIAKAARLAGFPSSGIRTVAVDSDLRMDPDHLLAEVRADRARHLEPFLVVASAGTTDSGTIDPLGDLAAITGEQGLWLHVDAAYGGFFQLTERGRKRLAGIGAADSITLDPHKGLSIPFGVGALLVRERRALLEANEGKGAYLQDQPGSVTDPASLGPELTRPFRGMHVWLPLQLHGVGAFRAELDKALDLAEHTYDRLRSAPWVERVWRPDLSIVAFQAHDDHQARSALEEANAGNRVFLSSTMVAGRYTLRIAILNRRTTRDHVDGAIDLLGAGLGA